MSNKKNDNKQSWKLCACGHPKQSHNSKRGECQDCKRQGMQCVCFVEEDEVVYASDTPRYSREMYR